MTAASTVLIGLVTPKAKDTMAIAKLAPAFTPNNPGSASGLRV